MFFFFNDTATTEIYTLSLHDALPILFSAHRDESHRAAAPRWTTMMQAHVNPAEPMPFRHAAVPHLSVQDRKSTRLTSSHLVISYAVFCFQKKGPLRHARRPCARRSAA